MKIVKTMMASAAIAMLAAQPVAAANSASKLSLANVVKSDVRASGKAGKSKAVAGLPAIAVILGAAALIAVVVVVADGDSDSN